MGRFGYPLCCKHLFRRLLAVINRICQLNSYEKLWLGCLFLLVVINAVMFGGRKEDTVVVTNGAIQGRSISFLNISTTIIAERRPRSRPEFKYIIKEPDLCQKGVRFVVYIHSDAMKADNRNLIRRTWGNTKYQHHSTLIVVFVTGYVNTTKAKKILEKESEKYHDIIKFDFIDTYKNLSHKGISALRWIKEHCMSADWVLKTDDDMLVNIFNFMRFVNRIEAVTKNFQASSLGSVSSKPVRRYNEIYCLVWNSMPVLRGKDCAKWCVTKEEWANNTFPEYCSGGAFFFPTQIVPRLYEAYFQAPFLWVDDVYITGILAHQAHVQLENIASLYELNPKFTKERLIKGEKIFVHYPGTAKSRAKWWPMVLQKEGIK